MAGEFDAFASALQRVSDKHGPRFVLVAVLCDIETQETKIAVAHAADEAEAAALFRLGVETLERSAAGRVA